MSETWLTNDENINIPDYNFIGNGRSNKRGGGVGCLWWMVVVVIGGWWSVVVGAEGDGAELVAHGVC